MNESPVYVAASSISLARHHLRQEAWPQSLETLTKVSSADIISCVREGFKKGKKNGIFQILLKKGKNVEKINEKKNKKIHILTGGRGVLIQYMENFISFLKFLL